MGRSILIRTLFLAVAAVGLSPKVQAAIYTFQAALDGPSVFPPNASPATGFASVIYDDVAHTMQIDASFSGLLSPSVSAHIHCCTANAGLENAFVATQVPSFVGFPLGVTAGAYSHTFDLQDLATYNPGFQNGQPANVREAALILAGLFAGKAYFDIHTGPSGGFPGGEIRGFLALVDNQVPLPGALPLFASGMGALGLYGWRRKRKLSARAT